MQCRVLGPLEITIEGVPARLGGHKQRALLALLIAAAGRVVSVDRLTDDLWGADPPAKASVSLQSYVANLRRILEPARTSRSPAQVLVSHPPGYALIVPTGSVDAGTFQRLAASAHDLVATDPALGRERLDSALGLWRGDAYADVVGAAPGLAAEVRRLDELHCAAVEDRWAAGIALGAQAEVIGEIEAFLTAHPLRESAWALLTLGLYRAHRQGDALDALRRARAVLADELGVDPGPELRRLESAVLAHDRSLSPGADVQQTSRRRQATDSPPLVGRNQVMTRLLAHVTQTASGGGRLALVTGEPGIGKTALARAVTASARSLGLRTGWGSCQPARGAPILWPWTQALGELLAGVDPATLHPVGARYPALGGLLPAAAPPGSAPRATDADSISFQQAEGIAALLTNATGPSLIVLDDVQWADPDSLAVLRWLAPKLDRLPVVLVVTCRDADADITPDLADAMGELARSDPDRVRLTGLELADVTAYLSRYDPSVPHPVVAAVLTRTDGNPFYLEEVVRLLVTNRTLTDPAAVATMDVPDGVRDVVRQRLAHLSPSVDRLLSAAALSGRSFDAELVRAAADLDADTADDAIDQAVSANLIVEEGTWHRFTHALVRDAIADRVGPAQRRRTHARLATAIEALWASALQDRCAELAFHYHQAGPRHARAAWTSAMRAAAPAVRHAPAEAMRLTELAATAISGDRTATALERHQVALALIRARQRAGQERAAWRTMVETATAALDAADPVAAAVAAVSIAGDTVWRWREYQTVDPTAVSLFRRLDRELPEDRSVLRARVVAMLAAELSYDPAHTDEAVALCEGAVAQIRNATGSTPQDLDRVLQARHLVLDGPGHLADRMVTAQELVTVARRMDDATTTGRALLLRGRDQIEAGHVAAGLADYAAARSVAEPHQVIPLLVALGFADAIVAIATGKFATARDSMRRAHALHSRTSLPGAGELPIALTATLHLARGTLDQAVSSLAAAAGHPLFREFYALALTKAGRRDDALAVIGPFDQQPDLPQDYLWLTRMAIRAALWSDIATVPELSRLRAQLAPFDDRIAIAGTGIAIAGYLGTWTGLLDRASGDLGRAVRTLDAALNRSMDAGFLPFAATTAHELAVTLRLRNQPGDPETAARYAAHAAELTLKIGPAAHGT